MNILLVKYQYLEAQISGKFVKQKKVGEYLVFSLFSYRHQRPPPLSLSRTTTICFSANAALENLRISSFDFQIQTVPNSFLGRKKLLRNVGTGCKGSSIYCSSSGDGAKEGKIIASWGENLFWFG